MHESYTCNTSISFNNTQSGVTFEEPFEKACLESIYCTCIVISATNINILIVMIHEASHECKVLSNFFRECDWPTEYEAVHEKLGFELLKLPA